MGCDHSRGLRHAAQIRHVPDGNTCPTTVPGRLNAHLMPRLHVPTVLFSSRHNVRVSKGCSSDVPEGVCDLAKKTPVLDIEAVVPVGEVCNRDQAVTPQAIMVMTSSLSAT